MSGKADNPRDPELVGTQPAAVEDLRRFPPAGPDCLAQRHLLRDYVDGDLPAASAARVEAHVHGCRSCALALGRVEAEQLQLREALDPAAVPGLQVPEDFASRLLERLRREPPADSADSKGSPSPTFTAQVMERVRAEALVSVAVQERRGLLRPVLLAALLLLGVALGIYTYGATPVAHLQVQDCAASQLRLPGADGRLGAAAELRAGQVLPLGAELRSGEGGHFELRMLQKGAAMALRAGAMTRLRPRAEDPWQVQLDEGDCAVDLSELEVESAALHMSLADGSRLQLAAGGRFELRSLPVRFADERAGIQVRVAVRSGQLQVLRGGQRREVAAGWTLSYHSFSGLELERSPDVALWETSRDAAAAQLAVTQTPELKVEEPPFGLVLDPMSGAPVVGASVVVETMLGPQLWQTGAAGGFRLASAAQLRGQFGLLRIRPPEGREELFGIPAQVISLESGPGPQRFVLWGQRTWHGILRDPEGLPQAGVWLQACLVDELLRQSMPLGHVTTAVDGRFELPGLPARLAGGQRLCIVAGRRDAFPQVVFSTAAPERSGPLELRLGPVVTQQVDGLVAEQEYQWMAAVPGTESLVVLRNLRSDSGGRLQLPRSLGWRFLRSLDGGGWQRLQETGAGLALVDAEAAGAAQWIRLAAGDADLPWSVRGSEPLPAHPLPAQDGLLLSVQDHNGRSSPGAQVYHQAADGGLGLLGIYDGRQLLRVPRFEAGRLLVRSSDGLLGSWLVESGDPLQHRSLVVRPPARLELPVAPSAAAVLQLRGADGQVILRPGKAGTVFVPAGSYHYRAADGGLRRLELQAGVATQLRR